MDVLRFEQSAGDYTILIRTDSIDYSWQRFHSRIREESLKYCKYTSKDIGTLTLCNPALTQQYKEAKEWEDCPPVIFETNKYQITIQFAETDDKPKVKHAKKEVEDFFFYDKDAGKDSKGCKLTGDVSFLNEPGVFKLEFEYTKKGVRHNEVFTFEIVSPKLDTKNDYKQILAEVNDEYENIVFRYLATTYQQLQESGKANTDEIWIQRFEEVIESYVKAVSLIVHQPHFRQRNITEYKHADRIKRWTPQMEEEYHEAEARGEERLEQHFFAYQERETTIDTLENRFVKYTLDRIGRRLTDVIDKILRSDNSVDMSDGKRGQLSDSKREQLWGYKNKLKKLSNHQFFKLIGRFEGMKQESLVLQNRTGYVQIYKSWIKLKRGIDLYNGVANIGTLQIWEIYELWCFVKMKRLVREVMGCKAEDIEENKETMLNPFTSSKVEHIVKFWYPNTNKTGDYVTLHYQHTYNRHKDEMHTATTEQRPDIVLNIEKVRDNITLTYLYDAKYRVADDNDVNNDKGTLADYPMPDAINQMHRYRDAIYYGSNYQEHIAKEIIGGYILFPGRGTNENIKERYYWKSIEKVNIGAFPLLPKDENTLLHEHLEGILLKKTKMEQIIDAKPQRGLHYAEIKQPTGGMYLIASIPDGRHQITASQKDFESGVAKSFRSLWNAYDKINVNSIKYLAPVINHGISNYYEVTGVFPVIEEGVAWMEYELGSCFSTNQRIDCDIKDDNVLLRTVTEFYNDMGKGRIICEPEQKIVFEESFD